MRLVTSACVCINCLFEVLPLENLLVNATACSLSLTAKGAYYAINLFRERNSAINGTGKSQQFPKNCIMVSHALSSLQWSYANECRMAMANLDTIPGTVY